MKIMTLDELADYMLPKVREHMIETGEWAPMIHGIRADGEGIIILLADYGDLGSAKDDALRAVGKLMTAQGVIKYAVAIEAWLAELPEAMTRTEALRHRARDAPNREEIVAISAADFLGQSVMRIYRTVRGESGSVIDLTLRPTPPHWESRLTQMLVMAHTAQGTA